MTSSTLSFIESISAPVMFVAFVVVSLMLIGSLAWRRRSTPLRGLPGLFPALITGTIVAVPAALVAVVLTTYYSPETTVLEIAVPAYLVVAVPIALCVLDIYAILPPERMTFAGALGRAPIAFFLAAAVYGFVSYTYTTLNGAASDAYWEEERRAVAARSEGLSLEVMVVGAKLGAVNENGRVVSNITLSITVRSVEQIQLLEAEPGFGSQDLWIRVVDSSGYEIPDGLRVPALIPAGFEKTYRLTAALSTGVTADDLVTGPWAAELSLYGPQDGSGLLPKFKATGLFTVADEP